MAKLLEIHPENPEPRKMKEVVEVLNDGGVVIYPTDTIYGIGCDIFNQKAVERVCRIKGVPVKKNNLSLICYDLSDISKYARQIDNPTFKMMKKALPGAFTFILNANSNVPKILNTNKKKVGIRVPDHEIPRLMVHELGNPIITTSIRNEDEIIDYTTDPSIIYDEYEKLVDLIIDGGYGKNIPSTVIDCTTGNPVVVRNGLGNAEELIQ